MWVGEEVIEVGCLGYGGTDGEGLLGLWDTADGSSFVQVFGTKVLFVQR